MALIWDTRNAKPAKGMIFVYNNNLYIMVLSVWTVWGNNCLGKQTMG